MQSDCSNRYTVFPLHALDAGRACTCSEGPACTRPGKHPAVRWGELAQGEVVQGPAGHGLVTGWKSGVFIVDTDGAEADGRFRALFTPEELATYTVRTPSGGAHYYFAWPGFRVRCSVGEYDWSEERDGWTTDDRGKPKKVSTKIDVRGDGGFAVLPGSPHKSGRSYEVANNVALIQAPERLLEWDGLRGRDLSESGANAPTPIDVATPEGVRRRALGVKACAEMSPAIKGENGSGAFFAVALRLVRTYELPLDVAAELVAEHYNPRCEPSWSGEEIQHKLEDARNKSDLPCGILSAAFLERLDVLSREKHRRAAVAASGRRVHDPAHRYEVEIGQRSNGEPAKTERHEVLATLWSSVEWDGVLAFDELRDEVVAVDPPTRLDAERAGLSEEDGDRIANWFAVCEMPMSVLPDVAFRAARVVAKRRSFNPIREYLQGLAPVWGSIEALAVEAMGLTDPIEITYVRKFLVAAVRRALNPGEKVDTALTLFGERGLRKSSFVTALFTDEWSSDSVGNIEDEKSVGEKLAGKWCVELAELRSLQGASPETVLAFLSRRTDRFRGAYKRGNAKDHPRTCVFVGTTNESEILRNASGADARRFWIVKPTRKIDTDWIRANRDDIWGEAYALAMAGELHYLTETEETVHYARAEQFEARDAWHDKIVAYCAGRRDGVTLDDVARSLGITTDKLDRRSMLRITDTFRREGFNEKKVGKARVRRWFPPEHIASAEPALAVVQPLRSAG